MNKIKTHGHTVGGKSPEYSRWLSMKARCYCPTDSSYKYYGARGIRVCERWRKSFDAFLFDMGLCPDGRVLDRINPFGNYEPSNCRWANKETSYNNRRDTRWLTLDGKTLSLTQWSRIKHINKDTLQNRINCGWSDFEALSMPTLPHGSNGYARGEWARKLGLAL
jgi:hypothetical protein